MELRCYQTKAKDAAIARFDAGDQRTLLVIPTGGGKTVVAGHIAKHYLGSGRVMVACHRDELLRQAADKFGQVTGWLPSIEKADERSDERNIYGPPKVVIGSIQTLRGRRLKQFNPHEFSLLWVDEAHHATAGTWKAIIDHFAQNPSLKVLGVTATPDRADGEALGQIFQSCAFEYGVLDIIENGYLVPIRQLSVEVEGLEFSKVRTSKGDLNESDLAEVMLFEEPLHGVTQATVEAACGIKQGSLKPLKDLSENERASALEAILSEEGDSKKRCLIFAVSVRHAERLAEIINRWLPGRAAHVDGTMTPDRRKDIFRRFKFGELQFLVNCMVATEGFDEPGVEIVVMARPTKSRALCSQMIGRGTRPTAELAPILGTLATAEERREAIAKSPKPHVLVLDFVGNSGRHKLMTVADVLGCAYEPEVIEAAREASESDDGVDVADALRAAKDEIERKRREAEARRKKREEEDERRRQAEAAKRASLVASADYTLYQANPFDRFAPAVHRDQPVIRNDIPAKHLSILSKAKLKPQEIAKLTPQSASELTQKIVKHWKLGLCSYRQAMTLKRFGVPKDRLETMTFDKAGEVISAIKANQWKPIDLTPYIGQGAA